MKSATIHFPFKLGFDDYHAGPDYLEFLNRILPHGVEADAVEIGFDETGSSRAALNWGMGAGSYIFEFNLIDDKHESG